LKEKGIKLFFNMSITVDTYENEIDKIAHTGKAHLPTEWMVLKFTRTSARRYAKSMGEIIQYDTASHV
jgi:uncharacterized protein Yka (UPF0111/DUF47 family)